MKIKTRITYSALKLARELPKMISNYMENVGEDIVEDAKKRIDNTNYLNAGAKTTLSQRTINQRKAGTLEGKPYGKAKYGDTPLKYTGKLYNTMKASSTGINMEKYGWYHNIGKSTDKILRPKREFLDIEPQKGKKTKKIAGKATREFNLQLKKNFEK